MASGIDAALQQDATDRSSPPQQGPSDSGLDAALQQDATLRGDHPTGGLWANFQAGISGAGQWLKNEAGGEKGALWHATGSSPVGTAAEAVKPNLRTPQDTSATTLPEYMARGAGSMLPFAVAGPEAGIGDVATALTSGAGSGAGQYAGERLATKGYEQQGGTLGALLGGVGGAAAPRAVGAAGEAVLPAVTKGGQEARATEALTDLAEGKPPNFEQAPIPNVPLNAAQSTNQPNVAAAVDELNSRDIAGNVQQRTAQNKGVTQAFTGSNGQEPALGPNMDLTQAPEVNAADASVRYVGALQRTNNLFRQHERALWQDPALTSLKLDANSIASQVQGAVKNAPPGLRREMEGGAATPLLQEITELGAPQKAPQPTATGVLDEYGQPIMRTPQAPPPATPSLDEYNAIRSDALETARSLRASGDMRGSKAAQFIADQLLTAMDNVPELSNNPAAKAAYQAARSFTRQKWQSLGYTPFQSVLRPNKYGNFAGTPDTAAGKLFDFSNGAQTVNNGFGGVNSLLDEVKNHWAAAPKLIGDPAQVQAVQNDLRTSLQDYITSKALKAGTSRTLDVSGNPNILPNALNQWIGKNRGWLSQSGIFDQNQINLLGRIQKTSEMLGRTENLQGSTNSRTYQRLMQGTLAERFMARALGKVGATAGAIAGGHAGVPELGAAAGYGAGRMMASIASMPSAGARSVLDRMLRDSDFAKDVMNHPQPSMWSKMQPRSQEIIRSAMVAGENSP